VSYKRRFGYFLMTRNLTALAVGLGEASSLLSTESAPAARVLVLGLGTVLIPLMTSAGPQARACDSP
jgi:hypothetical protein